MAKVKCTNPNCGSFYTYNRRGNHLWQQLFPGLMLLVIMTPMMCAIFWPSGLGMLVISLSMILWGIFACPGGTCPMGCWTCGAEWEQSERTA